MTPSILTTFQKNGGTETASHWPKITQLGYKPGGLAVQPGLWEVQRALPAESGDLGGTVGSIAYYLRSESWLPTRWCEAEAGSRC